MYDYHTHTNFSEDCFVPMEHMIDRAVSLGLTAYAITDHYDPDYCNHDYTFSLDFPSYHEALLSAQHKYKSSIRVVKGIELGIQLGEPMQKCRDAALGFPYDFIIGSIHCAEGQDVYMHDYYEGRSPEDVYRGFYAYMLECFKQFKDYDVIGHFNIIDRYAPVVPDDSAYMDIVKEIMQLIINDGKGIEINTSSDRHASGRRTPTKELLQMYVDLGGETVTTGSDAHDLEIVGRGLSEAHDMIIAAGLKYVAVFKDRKVSYIKIA
ncbi:MAG: histidinol-phosphatase HisJ family protein [Clostridiales Family XIII bacterium]|nr:histidinol-phosphatase HisJ family protein [Clostridiales Family XIII bacterium]